MTARFGPRIPPRHRVRHRLGSAGASRRQPPLGTHQIRDRGSPKPASSGQLPTADQRNGRYDPLVFLAPLFLAGALLLAMFLFLAPAVLLAALFLAAF